jgi:8-oxo-dGTP pyrophosphatase MutT (NUDIX family)
LRAADGAFLLGVMAPHTANAGKIYFPSGTPDPSDLVGTAVDFDRSVWREVAEETGLTQDDLAGDPGWTAVSDGALLPLIKVLRAREDAAALRARILRFLATEPQPEFADVRIVRGPQDFDPMMPDFVRAFLNSAWAACG